MRCRRENGCLHYILRVWAAAQAACSRIFCGRATPAAWKTDLAFHVGSGGDALAILLDRGLLQPVQVAQQIAPFDAEAFGGAKIRQFLLQQQSQERAEHVTADRLIRAVIDWPGAHQRLSPAEQNLHLQKVAVAKDRLQGA